MSVQLQRQRRGLYFYRAYRIERHDDGAGPYWEITNQSGRNWLANVRTLRDARAYLAGRR